KITRLVATTTSAPAAQSLAVKVRRAADAEDNIFVPLVNKGDVLPASGQLQLKSGAMLKAGMAGYIGFEVFQVEVPDRVDLNLCIGLLRIEGADLPPDLVIRIGDPIIFGWHMSAGGVLRASVTLPESNNLVLPTKHFYAPQAAEISYNGEEGHAFTQAILARAQEEWGDLAAAVGPNAGPDLALLKARIEEQNEILEESRGDAEAVRRISEEARFIRQEAARIEAKHQSAVLQRRLGKVVAAYNRIGRGRAEESDNKIFDDLSMRAQKIIDSQHESTHAAARLCLSQMRRLFLSVAWGNPAYVEAWFDRLAKDSWLYADKAAFAAMLAEGAALREKSDHDGLRTLVEKMLEARLSLGASDTVNDLATVVRG
ncbi:MAG TPA: hypothetical protein DCY07_06045, partial [Rhodospirillaceae bacterium]|nr:hypothetical protein [Rhodospirillaceae bacterium]